MARRFRQARHGIVLRRFADCQYFSSIRRPYGLLNAADKNYPHDAASSGHNRADYESRCKVTRAVYDPACQRANDDAGEIAKAVLKPSPFAGHRRPSKRLREDINVWSDEAAANTHHQQTGQ